MTISVRSNKTRSWYVADVRFAGRKIYLGMYDFDDSGLVAAQAIIITAKRIIQGVKQEVKGMPDPVKEQRFAELKENLRGLAQDAVAND